MKRKLRKTLALLLTVCMVLCMLPIIAGADGMGDSTQILIEMDEVAAEVMEMPGKADAIETPEPEESGDSAEAYLNENLSYEDVSYEDVSGEEESNEPPAERPVKLVETGALFFTLNEAIAAAKSYGYNAFTLAVIGNVTETSDVIIGSETVTIVGADGAHTITMVSVPGTANRLVVGGGGTLTLGDGTEANHLTFLCPVRVTDGTINMKDGIALKSSTALEMSGPNANGTISGGRLEGNTIALSMGKGARLSEISGGVFTGKQDAVHLSDAGTKIDRISGGAFYQTDPDITLHGHAIFIQNDSQIGEISGGYFDAVRNSAMVLIRGGKVGEISGGEFVAHRVGSYANDDRNAAIWVENGWKSEGFVGSGIGTISGGYIKGTNFGLLLIADYGYCYANYITGGTFEGTVALQNDRGSTITEISGGTFIGSQGILNVNKIGKIGGQAQIQGASSYGIFNYFGGTIDEISGGTISSGKDHGIANAGTIKLISGGTIIGYRSAINCDGLNKGKLETITNGVFLGKNSTAIMLGYPLTLEPGLSAYIGFGRYWGKDGVIFNKENLVNYPDGYWMSSETKPVAGITDFEFKYLTNGREPDPLIVTFDTNGGSFSDNTTATTHDVTPPEATVGAADMPADPQYEGHTFLGWNTNKDGSGTAFTGDTPVDSDVTVYAQWKQDDDGTPTIVITEKPGNPGGGTDGGTSGPPAIETPGEEEPLDTFITEHVAYIVGYPDGKVGPNRNITRAEVATIFFRLLTDEVRARYWAQDNPFSDVQRGMWHNNAVSVMHRMRIIHGYPDETFKPGGPITRAEFAAMAARFARMMKTEPLNGLRFIDIAGHWAEADVAHAAAVGWVNGYPDSTFKPNQYITRAEVMTLVNRMLERMPETAGDLLDDKMITWPDNADPNVWYYLAVQEATNSHMPEYKDKTVPGLQFSYEYWVEMMPNRDWAALERD